MSLNKMRKYKPVLSKGSQEFYSAQVWLTLWLDSWGRNPVTLYVRSLSWYEIFFSGTENFTPLKSCHFQFPNITWMCKHIQANSWDLLSIPWLNKLHLHGLKKHFYADIFSTEPTGQAPPFVWPSGTNFVGETTSKRNLLSIASSVGLTLQSLRSSANTVWSSYKTVSSMKSNIC